VSAMTARHTGETTPRTDLHTLIVVQHALGDLAFRRYLDETTIGARHRCHLLASIVAQAELWLAEDVEAVRRDGGSWGEIGHLLGTTATEARTRWSSPSPTQSKPTPTPVRRRSAEALPLAD
jgi:hypothetical protein